MTDARNPWDPPTVEEVIGPILAACPSFAGVWAAAAGSQWAGSEANGYWVMVELANHLVALRRRGETGEIGATFDQIEVMLGEADASLESSSRSTSSPVSRRTRSEAATGRSPTASRRSSAHR